MLFEGLDNSKLKVKEIGYEDSLLEDNNKFAD